MTLLTKCLINDDDTQKRKSLFCLSVLHFCVQLKVTQAGMRPICKQMIIFYFYSFLFNKTPLITSHDLILNKGATIVQLNSNAAHCVDDIKNGKRGGKDLPGKVVHVGGPLLRQLNLPQHFIFIFRQLFLILILISSFQLLLLPAPHHVVVANEGVLHHGEEDGGEAEEEVDVHQRQLANVGQLRAGRIQ